MARPANVPAGLRRGPFHIDEAAKLGVGHDRLRGRSYERLFPRVWVWTEHVMTEACWRRAARLTLPGAARSTGFTRIQELGLDVGDRRPLQYVVGRDLHRDVDGLTLHRTDLMPGHDDVGVHPAAAFVELCRWGSVLDAVAAGDWLLAEGLMTTGMLHELARREAWREGVTEALWVAPLLTDRSRSPQESRTRVYFVLAGLPAPESNAPVVVDGRTVAEADWWWKAHRFAAEYEGGQHQDERGQYVRDIDRYAIFRGALVEYVQITRELFARPTVMVSKVHHGLCGAGYRGPAPRFGALFRAATSPVPVARLVRGAWEVGDGPGLAGGWSPAE